MRALRSYDLFAFQLAGQPDIGGVQVGRGRVEISVAAAFTASESFDVGTDLGSPVSLDYYARAPFAFNGTLDKLDFAYIDTDEMK